MGAPKEMTKNESNSEKIYQMLYKCNRPTSKSEVIANFKGEITGTGIQDSLDLLEESGRITTKMYNKTKIYLVNQDMFQGNDNTELDQKIEKYSKESEILKSELSSLHSEVEMLNGILSIEQLNERINILTETTATNEIRLSSLKSGGREISKKDMTAAAKAHSKTMVMLKKVRKIFNEMIETLSEGMDMKKSQLYEELGIEM